MRTTAEGAYVVCDEVGIVLGGARRVLGVDAAIAAFAMAPRPPSPELLIDEADADLVSALRRFGGAPRTLMIRDNVFGRWIDLDGTVGALLAHADSFRVAATRIDVAAAARSART